MLSDQQVQSQIATGPLVACIPNMKMPKFTIIGECVMKALKLESECEVNRIHCDEQTKNDLAKFSEFKFHKSRSESGSRSFYILTELTSSDYIIDNITPKQSLKWFVTVTPGLLHFTIVCKFSKKYGYKHY